MSQKRGSAANESSGREPTETADSAKAAKSSRGGFRKGAGRKKNSGAFGEATIPMRVPESAVEAVNGILASFKEQVRMGKSVFSDVSRQSESSRKMEVPLITPRINSAKDPVEAGMDRPLDLGSLLVKKPESSFFIRVKASDNKPSGMQTDDYALVDRGQRASDGDAVAALSAGRMVFATARETPKGFALELHLKTGKTQAVDGSIWGVVRGVVRIF